MHNHFVFQKCKLIFHRLALLLFLEAAQSNTLAASCKPLATGVYGKHTPHFKDLLIKRNTKDLIITVYIDYILK